MTPLAQKITKQNLLPIKEREPHDWDGLYRKMSDIHCFEMSEVFALANDLSWSIQEGKQNPGGLAFLPAPRTWIEFSFDDNNYRYGYLLIDDGHGSAEIYFAGDAVDDGYWTSGREDFDLRLFHPLFNPSSLLSNHQTKVSNDMPGEYQEDWAQLYAFLSLINSPKVIGRRQHMPHRGLEKGLLREQKMIGKFPLHAWTEIKLECSPTRDMSEEEGYEAHLTGKKALHFCRAHLRLRECRVEFVRSHWRGDPSLGIKQSRYKVQPRRLP